MAGPLTGTWKASLTGQQQYIGPAKWGTGINPVHSMWGGNGRNTAPGVSPASRGLGTLTAVDTVTDEVPDSLTAQESYGYQVEDLNQDWAFQQPDFYGYEGGPADRPDWTETNGYSRATAGQYPTWGNYPTSGGAWIRSLNHGSALSTPNKLVPSETVSEGWLNKDHGRLGDAATSDVSQYEMQTSMVQRYKVRAGSQISGTASEYDAPIESRATGQKIKDWSTGQRTYDMFPYQQEPNRQRPFFERQMGTGYVDWMHPNEMYVSEPMLNSPAGDPYQGTYSGQKTLPTDYIAEDVYY